MPKIKGWSKVDSIGVKETQVEWVNDNSRTAIKVADHNNNGGSTGWEIWKGKAKKGGGSRVYNRRLSFGGQTIIPNKKKAMKYARTYMRRHPEG
ncbi:MAG: hypothetical protein ABEI78_01415 [Candidatus Nanohaloarchaea archaeon]